MAINSLSSSSHGLSGLVSGMDTQQMVEKMLSGTQGKIDAAKQKQTTLTYKQTMYRDVAAKLKGFQSSYLSYLSTSTANLRSQQFFNTMSAASSSSAFRASAVTGATAGKTTVNYVRQLAQTMKLKSNNAATGKLTGEFSRAKVDAMADNLADAKNNLKIQAGTDAAIEISLKDLAGKSGFELETVLKDALAGSSISVEYKDGQFSFKEADGKELSISGKPDAMALVGLGRETDLYGKEGKITTNLNGKNLLPSISVSLNGVTKSVTFDPFTATNATEFAKQLNAGVQSAFGTAASVVVNGSGQVEFKTKDNSSILKVSRPAYQSNGLDALGIASGSSTKITLGMTLGEANFNTDIAGNVQRFSIGGVDFSFGSDASINEVITSINSSDAGVKISYLDVEDRFVIESTVSGELAGIDSDNPFKMSQTEGNLLTAMFGVQPGNAVSGNSLTYVKNATGSGFDTGTTFDMKDKVVGVKYKGSTYELKLKGKEDGTEYTMTEMAAELTQLAKSHFREGFLKFGVETVNGKESLKVTSDQGTSFELKGLGGDSADSTVPNFGIPDGTTIGTVPATSTSTLGEMGITGTTIKIGGVEVDLTGVTTLGDLQQKLDAAVKAIPGVGPDAGASFDSSTGRYRLFGVDIPMTFEISGDGGKLFGSSKFTLGSDGTTDIVGPGKGLTMTQQGQNAIVSINGTEIERNSNEFTINGIGYEFKAVNMKQDKDVDGNLLFVDADGNTTTSATAADGTANKTKGANNAEEVTVSRDTEKIVEGLKKFVEDYNKLADEINGLLGADAKKGYREYPPLTAAQKEGMSEKEIEQWEEKSKQGLLRGDNILEGVMQSLRSVLYTKPDSSKVSLYNIGITTSNPLAGDKDHLVLDESKLKQMVAEAPDDIMKLFTDETQGIANLLNNAVDNAIRTTPDKLGSIVQQAGATGQNITDSFLFKELKSVDDRITSLNLKYKSEYNRYWSQFNKMEQVIAQMNQQSSWLSQQTGG